MSCWASGEMANHLMRVPAPVLGRILLIAFGLNWVWEAAHAVAFVESQGTFAFRLWHCLPMAATDALWTIGLWAVMGGMWPSAPRWSAPRLAALAAVGALTAATIERVALATGRWTYNAVMPVIPLVDAGLWPVLQMSILPLVAVWLADRRTPRGPRRLTGPAGPRSTKTAPGQPPSGRRAARLRSCVWG